MSRRGRVYLVGAGPGDPELLTLKGLRALREADLVVYDRLANPRLLKLAPESAGRVYVGKGAQQHGAAQEEINRILVEAALAGKTVCRLKGGDPFVFGRGGEEAEALAAAGVEWEYLPGITSAVAVPGYAGIPVTTRGLCSSLTIVAGREIETGLRWEHLARGADTLVFLMGLETLPQIVEQLRAHGLPAETPAAVIEWGTYPRQRTVESTLAEIAPRCAAAGLSAPAVTVVGEVAGMRARLRWFDTRPLFGRRVAVTRPRAQEEELAAALERAGAEVLRCPAIRIRAVPDPDLAGLAEPYDWVVFTSANGVRCLLSALRGARRDLRALGTARIAAIGPETERAAREAGLWVDFVPTRYVAEGVAEEFPEPVTGRRILIPRAREARELLPDQWRRAGAVVDVVPVYETVADEEGIALLGRALEAGEVDAVTFTASSTVRAAAVAVPAALLEPVAVACIGPITADAAREAGFRVEVEAGTHTAAGLVEALEAYYAGRTA